MAYVAAEQPDLRVSKIEISLGDEWIKHDFGRPVDMAHARKWLLRYMDALTLDQPPLARTKAKG